MAGIIGNIGHFDENVEQWSSYTERFQYFIEANEIVPTFLSVIGPKCYNLLRSLLQPEKPGTKTYQEIVNVLKGHFSPKPLVIAERFRFHHRCQGEGESVPMFAAVLRKLAEHCDFGDTGAAVSIVSDTIYQRTLKHLPLQHAEIVLKTYTGES